MKQLNPHFLALLATYASVFLLSCNGLFSRSISLSALDITFHRSWIAFIALSVFLIYNKHSLLLSRKSDYLWALLLGTLLSIHWITFFHSMQVAGVAVGMIALYTYPMFTAFIEPWFTKIKMDKTDLFSALLVLVGIYLLVPNFSQTNSIFAGVFWGIISAITFSLRNLIQKYRFSHYPAAKSLNYQVLVSFVLLAAFFQQGLPLEFGQFELNNSWMLLILGVFFTATPHTLFAFALNHLKAKSVSLISCAQPVLAALFAYWILDEGAGLNTIIGGALILAAAVMETVHVHKAVKS